MARIIARFSDELIEAAVSVGRYDEASSRFLTRTLIERRDAILRRYLRVLSPITDLAVRGDQLCGVDLARKTQVIGDVRASFAVSVLVDGDQRSLPASAVDAKPSGELCIDLGAALSAAALPSSERYLVLAISNGDAPEPLYAHVYSYGATTRRSARATAPGFQLVGIERE
jgi:hypothetical protein